MLGEHDSIAISTSSGYAKELRRWEAHHTKYGPPGRPFVQMEYPKMLYKLEQVTGKGIQIADRHTVANEDEERNMHSRGFYALPEAQARLEKQHTEHGTLAAEREYAIQHGRHSAAAVEEIRAAEAEHGARHLPDVAETPIRRRRSKVTKGEK